MSESMSYHDRPELSSTQVAAYLSDKVEWYHQYVVKDWERPQPTAAMRFGTMIHDMIERGGPDAIKMTPRPDGLDLRTKAGKAFYEEMESAGFSIVTADEYRAAQTMWTHLRLNDFTRGLIECGQKEVEHYWHDADLGHCRCKIDVVLGAHMADWKTTSCRSERSFVIDAVDRFYDVRLALYRRGFRDKYGCNPQIFVVSIRTSGGFQVNPYRLDEDWLDDAEARLLMTVDEMRRFCLEEFVNQAPQLLTQPRWAPQFQFEEAI